MSREIGAIILFCEDVGAMAKWYEDIVGVGKAEAMGADHAGLMVGDMYIGFDKKSPAPPTGSIELFFSVDDPDASFAAGKAKGAQVYAEPSDKEYGRDCSFVDPAGNHVWLWKSKG